MITAMQTVSFKKLLQMGYSSPFERSPSSSHCAGPGLDTAHTQALYPARHPERQEGHNYSIMHFKGLHVPALSKPNRRDCSMVLVCAANQGLPVFFAQ